MQRTCSGCHGSSFEYNESNLRRCSGCQKVYYCSIECRDNDWCQHVFDCSYRPVNTADHLALACYEDMIPTHPETREDYGFSRTVGDDAESKLIGLYIGLIKIMDISPMKIHKWRIRGALVEKIKAEYYKYPEGSRGLYFPWFLQNEHVIALAGQPLPKEALDANSDAERLHVWRFIGGSEWDTMKDINMALARMQAEEKNSYHLYLLLLSGYLPTPNLELWVDFGFAACTSEAEEMRLRTQYDRLIHMCTFKEFCDAHREHLMLGLFRSKEVQLTETECLRDLLGSWRQKSVWLLKQYIRQEEPQARAHIPVVADYFFGCCNDSEWQELRKVYKAFFESPAGNPLALHQAAIQGNIYDYVSTIVPNLDPKFRRLMKNLYPLPRYDSEDDSEDD